MGIQIYHKPTISEQWQALEEPLSLSCRRLAKYKAQNKKTCHATHATFITASKLA